jgi:hypothetical protein
MVTIFRSHSAWPRSRRAGDVAHTQAGRQGLGKAADVDYAFQLVQCGQARRAGRQQVGEGVILDDQEIMLRRHLQQTGAPWAG